MTKELKEDTTIFDIYEAMGLEVVEHQGKKSVLIPQDGFMPKPFDIKLRVIPETQMISGDSRPTVTFKVLIGPEVHRGPYADLLYDPYEVELTLPISQVHILKEHYGANPNSG